MADGRAAAALHLSGEWCDYAHAVVRVRLDVPMYFFSNSPEEGQHIDREGSPGEGHSCLWDETYQSGGA